MKHVSFLLFYLKQKSLKKNSQLFIYLEKDRDSIQNNSITELGDEYLLQSHEGMSEDEFIAFKKKKKKKKKSKGNVLFH